MASKSSKRIAFVGNPNAGKTTLFNSLTGSRQKVGNYAGVTVERVSAIRRVGSFECEFIDVPGLYSLTPASEDEAVAVKVLEEETDLSAVGEVLAWSVIRFQTATTGRPRQSGGDISFLRRGRRNYRIPCSNRVSRGPKKGLL